MKFKIKCNGCGKTLTSCMRESELNRSGSWFCDKTNKQEGFTYLECD